MTGCCLAMQRVLCLLGGIGNRLPRRLCCSSS